MVDLSYLKTTQGNTKAPRTDSITVTSKSQASDDTSAQKFEVEITALIEELEQLYDFGIRFDIIAENDQVLVDLDVFKQNLLILLRQN